MNNLHTKRFANFRSGPAALALIIWLIIIQSVFIYLQNGNAIDLKKSLHLRLRSEVNSTDPNLLARGIADLEAFGLLKCAKISSVRSPLFPLLNLSYKDDCEPNRFSLKGSKVETVVKSLNGESWNISFLSVNSPSFYLALWATRIIGIFTILFFEFASYLRQRSSDLILAAEVKQNLQLFDLAGRVAHDIRSPITALNIGLSKLEDQPIKALLTAASDRIKNISDDLSSKTLQSKANNGSAKADERVELNRLMEALLREKALVAPHGCVFQISKSREDVFVAVNKSELLRCFSNLINNSIEALGEFGKIEISIRKTNDWVDVSVRDNGRGIPEEIIPAIGQRGMSYEKESVENAGSGLGIYFTKNVIEKFGGKLFIESKFTKGTTVTIRLPRK